MNTKEQKQAIREKLSQMSQRARDYRDKLMQEAAEKGEDMRVIALSGTPLNDFIIELFYEGEKHEFNTFKGWLEVGKVVKKGEKGYVIWGRPIKGEQKNEEKEVEKTYKMFPISYIFRDDQVKELETVNE
jgi:hypothetical protein